MGTTLAVLDASIGETPAEENLRRELDADVEVYKISDGVFPPSVSSSRWRFDGVVISGSQTSVYDDLDWIHEATEWVRRVHEADVPILGICWGHQFIAQVLGGRVVDMGEYELGYESIARIGDDPLFDGVPDEFVSFETHSDRVAEVPPGATTIARNDIGVQAFRVGRAYGVQFHPEYDRATAEWVTEAKDLPDERIRTVLDEITDDAVERARAAKTVFDNFLDIAAIDQPVRCR
ncbi:type 1 glutamine amidotransferase [Halobaculum gomorrense]|uniref:GMP synthase (Glutamine-hydrolysing) n=1 Tax=Halobaculum gomorrense TaxID=43928 RepID=A0A1M5NS15_9EURY|nr:type 1 glutamine amidotransferase [Halobaculum gomorrense]SHG92235.1 GMP synthase (glutamine-hydrolysing) [Halobaculum gomorrense]